jgi:putative nucleotidyltransferase with HDIG domain
MTVSELRTLYRRLPVFPVCAATVIRLARTELSFEQLVRLAESDPVIAGNVIAASNSAARSWSTEIRNVPDAVTNLGEIKCTQVLISAALRPLLVLVGHTDLYHHSLEVAHVNLRLSRATSLLDTADAYVLGLVHDIGKLVLTMAGLEKHLEQLLQANWNRLDAEQAVYGMNHASAGAEIVQKWGLPTEYVNAVAFHHAPEKGGGSQAAMLYLSDQWTDPDGDLLCNRRLQYSLDALGLTMADFSECAGRKLSL